MTEWENLQFCDKYKLFFTFHEICHEKNARVVNLLQYGHLSHHVLFLVAFLQHHLESQWLLGVQRLTPVHHTILASVEWGKVTSAIFNEAVCVLEEPFIKIVSSWTAKEGCVNSQKVIYAAAFWRTYLSILELDWKSYLFKRKLAFEVDTWKLIPTISYKMYESTVRYSTVRLLAIHICLLSVAS